MAKQEDLTLEHYRLYILNNLPDSWKRVSINHNVVSQMIDAITNYCFNHKLFGNELYLHLHENELVCAAHWSEEPQGLDWWMDLSSEASLIEQNQVLEQSKVQKLIQQLGHDKD